MSLRDLVAGSDMCTPSGDGAGPSNAMGSLVNTLLGAAGKTQEQLREVRLYMIEFAYVASCLCVLHWARSAIRRANGARNLFVRAGGCHVTQPKTFCSAALSRAQLASWDFYPCTN